jgi:hypothetical protein
LMRQPLGAAYARCQAQTDRPATIDTMLAVVESAQSRAADSDAQTEDKGT